MLLSRQSHLALASLLALSCGENHDGQETSAMEDSSSSAGTDTDTDTGEPPVFYDAMIQRSLVSVGNNHRIKRAMAKAANGEEMTIAYIGGSITEGYTLTPEHSYVVGSYEAFKSQFASGDGSHVHFVNAGMGGTPSTLGMIRYERDVLRPAPTPPDIVFVEFAVNDGDDPTEGAAYESLVRTILLSENAPAVVLVFSVFRSKWNLQDRLAPIGEDYQLPMISIKDAVVPELTAGTLTDDEFFRDQYHPTSFGFQVMTDSITHYFTTVAALPTDPEDIMVPETATIGYQFTGITMVDPTTETIEGELEIDPGSFTAVDETVTTYEHTPSVKKFPENWHKETADTNDPFVMNVTAKNLALVYKKTVATTFGAAEIYVDGALVKTVAGRSSDGWNNPVTVILLDEEVSAPHAVEIRMTEEDAAKRFTILGLGYTP